MAASMHNREWLHIHLEELVLILPLVTYCVGVAISDQDTTGVELLDEALLQILLYAIQFRFTVELTREYRFCKSIELVAQFHLFFLLILHHDLVLGHHSFRPYNTRLSLAYH